MKGVVVVLVARRQELLEEVAREIKEKGGKALIKVVDVTDMEQVQSMGRWVREKVGLPTILVNNAGTGITAEFATQKPGDWHPTIDVIINGGLSCINEFLADMKVAKKGHIVNITSLNEKPGICMPGAAVYTGAKQFWAGKTNISTS